MKPFKINTNQITNNFEIWPVQGYASQNANTLHELFVSSVQYSRIRKSFSSELYEKKVICYSCTIKKNYLEKFL